jgi:hypothetical protein
MKKIFAVVFAVLAMGATSQAQNKQEVSTHSVEYINLSETAADPVQLTADQSEEEDFDAYRYTKRIRRFNNPLVGFSYFCPAYATSGDVYYAYTDTYYSSTTTIFNDNWNNINSNWWGNNPVGYSYNSGYYTNNNYYNGNVNSGYYGNGYYNTGYNANSYYNNSYYGSGSGTVWNTNPACTYYGSSNNTTIPSLPASSGGSTTTTTNTSTNGTSSAPIIPTVGGNSGSNNGPVKVRTGANESSSQPLTTGSGGVKTPRQANTTKPTNTYIERPRPTTTIKQTMAPTQRAGASSSVSGGSMKVRGGK